MKVYQIKTRIPTGERFAENVPLFTLASAAKVVAEGIAAMQGLPFVVNPDEPDAPDWCVYVQCLHVVDLYVMTGA